MAGMIGWIDFSRDLREHRSTLRAMISTLARRGPDSESIWSDTHAGFGHRGLATNGAVEPQPYATETGDGVVAVVSVGHPVGIDQLRERLCTQHHVYASELTSVAAVVAQAYLHLGVDWVRDITGSHAFAVWDGRSNELVLGRDRLGGQPIYFITVDGGILFGSERKALLMHPLVEPHVSSAGLRQAISQALPHGGIFSGIQTVGAAEITRFTQDGLTRHRYWSWGTRPHTDDLANTIDTVRQLLETSVADNLSSSPERMMLMLSGGIDSSAVAALAARQLHASGDRLKTTTIEFAGSTFRTDVMRTSHDTPFADMVANHLKTQHTLVELEAGDILDPVVRLGMLQSKDFPTRQYDMDTAQYLTVQQASRQGASVVLAGYGGDKYFQGGTWFTMEPLVTSGTFPWIALAQRHGSEHGFGTGLLNADTLNSLDLPTYYADEYAKAIAEVEYLPEDEPWQRHMRRIAYLMNTRFSIDAGSYAAAGLQLRSPINHPDLMEYTYNVPNAWHQHGGIEKGLLRAAVADLLPPPVVKRHRSASPVSHHPTYSKTLHTGIRELVCGGHHPVRDLLDLTKAKQLLEQPQRIGEDRMARADIELMLQLDLWMSRYNVQLEL